MQCYDFKYQGSTISNNASQDIELRYRMAIASAAFGKPQDRFGKTGICLLKSSAMSIKVLSFLPSSVVLKHAWTIHQRKWRRSCLVPRPHYSARPKRFESRGPRKNVFRACSTRIRHQSELTERAWENAVQGLAPFLYGGTSKSNNERILEGQDHECGESLPCRTTINGWYSHWEKCKTAGSRA